MPHLRDHLQSKLGDSYTIERELGGGGMSRVFVATDRALGRRVVVKVLPPNLAASVSVERFRREIQFAARLQHPHIVPLLSSGEIDGLPYFAMPFVEGESLRERLSREDELPIPEAVRILREIASALAYAHERGIVHRDIKPANVLLSSGSSAVTDFGVAKALTASAQDDAAALTAVGSSIGSPGYMAPEQVLADPHVDHRADLYALGAIGYEMLAGRPVFIGRTMQAVVAAHVVQTPQPITMHRPSVPAELSDLIACCLEKKPADRPQSATEFVRRLDANWRG
jgi:eukaryotic-like serine/threonine-protein kinase